jgi:hypothetical protein
VKALTSMLEQSRLNSEGARIITGQLIAIGWIHGSDSFDGFDFHRIAKYAALPGSSVPGWSMTGAVPHTRSVESGVVTKTFPHGSVLSGFVGEPFAP